MLVVFLKVTMLQSLPALGSAQPKVVLYLDNRPKMDDNQILHIPSLIAANGNHWRKIFSIFAKLNSDQNWREYRDQKLLLEDEQIQFATVLQKTASIHIFSGKSCWQRFGVTPLELAEGEMQALANKKVFYYRSAEYGLMLYTPYFDYRQFPNVLVEQVKQLMINA